MARTFAADLKQFRNLTRERMVKVVKDSVQDVLQDAQTTALGITRGGTLQVGKLPVDTGQLANSLVSTPNGGAGSASYVTTVAGYQLGETMRFVWDTEYAMAVEMGTSTFSGWHFVGANAAKWQEYVADNVRKHKG